MCEAWSQARQEMTDHEMVGPAIGTVYQEPGKFTIGTDIPDIEYCPWCGAQLPDDEHE